VSGWKRRDGGDDGEGVASIRVGENDRSTGKRDDVGEDREGVSQGRSLASGLYGHQNVTIGATRTIDPLSESRTCIWDLVRPAR
jgi:hypothetical protein